MDRIVIETDSPYLTPIPNRGLTNEPGFVPFVAEKISEIKNMTMEEVSEALMRNSEDLYEITEGLT